MKNYTFFFFFFFFLYSNITFGQLQFLEDDTLYVNAYNLYGLRSLDFENTENSIVECYVGRKRNCTSSEEDVHNETVCVGPYCFFPHHDVWGYTEIDWVSPAIHEVEPLEVDYVTAHITANAPVGLEITYYLYTTSLEVMDSVVVIFSIDYEHCESSGTTAIETIDHYISELSLYPNPVKNSFKINGIWKTDKPINYRLIGMQGNIKARGIIDAGQMTINVEHCAGGVYFLELTDGTSKRTMKVVVSE